MIRAELDALYRLDNEARAEHAQWLARREARARSFVRKSDDPAGLTFKTVENEAAPAPTADVEPSDAAMGDDSGAITQLWEKIDRLDEASDQCFGYLERKIIDLRTQVDELRAMIEADRKTASKRRRRRNV